MVVHKTMQDKFLTSGITSKIDMNRIEKLTELFKQFPGIGPRQAKRFVYFLLTQPDGYIDVLISNIKELKTQVTQCPICFYHFTKDNYSNLCDVCSREDTEKSSLLIVAKDVDVDAIKKVHVYAGRFFVLGGTLPFLEKDIERFIRQQALITYIQSNKDVLKEIIFALPVTPEGDHTYFTLKESIVEILPDIRISLLGRGLSTGTEIEYSDPETIAEAFKTRR